MAHGCFCVIRIQLAKTRAKSGRQPFSGEKDGRRARNRSGIPRTLSIQRSARQTQSPALARADSPDNGAAWACDVGGIGGDQMTTIWGKTRGWFLGRQGGATAALPSPATTPDFVLSGDDDLELREPWR